MSTHRVTVELPAASYRNLQRMVESGEYASESDAVIAALVDFSDGDTDIPTETKEKWLRDEVVPIALRAQANPGSGYTSDEVMAHINADMLALDEHADAA